VVAVVAVVAVEGGYPFRSGVPAAALGRRAV